MSDALQAHESDAQAFVIDLKPSNAGNVSLYAVRQVWGYSDHDWTPVMLELETLLGDEDPTSYDKCHFRWPGGEAEQVFTFLYLSGSVVNGQLTGTWNFPRPSSTNSVLLWRYALDYFTEQAGYVRRPS